jgi:hypothetical protein
MARTAVALALAGVVAVAASAMALAAGPPTAPLRDCNSRIETNRPYTGRVTADDVRLGPVILTRYPDWRRPLRTSASNPDPDDWPYILKAPVRLRAGTTATLAIAPEATDLAAILPGDTREWLSAVRFHACAPSKRAFAYTGKVGPFTGFGQVIGLKKPSVCVPIEVWLENRAAPVRRIVPVGRLHC